MDFQTQKFYFNTSSERVRTTIRSVACANKSQMAQSVLVEIYANLISDPRLMYCDNQMFDNMTTRHDGTQWVIVMEAIVPKKEFQL